MFKIVDTVSESFHFRIELTYCGAVTSLTQFDGRGPRVECGQQLRFDTLQLDAHPTLVMVSQSGRFGYSARRRLGAESGPFISERSERRDRSHTCRGQRHGNPDFTKRLE